MSRRRAKRLKSSNAQPSQNVNVPTNLEEALQYLELDIDSVRKDDLTRAVNIISQFASSGGLKEDALILLVDVIGECKFSVAVSKKLISCLTPSGSVPENAVISAISWISTRKMSITLQISLLQWIVATCTYGVIDRTDRLHLLYDVVFGFLHYEELSPHICHLLFLLTQKENVKIFHIQKLIHLQKKCGAQSHIMALLNLYHQLRPDYLNIQPKPLKCFRVSKQWQHLTTAPSGMAITADQRLITVTKRNAKQLLTYQDLVDMAKASKSVAAVLNSQHRRLLITSCEDILVKLKLLFMAQIDYEQDNEKGCKLLKTMGDVLAETYEELTAEEYVFYCLPAWDGQKFFPEVLSLIPHLTADLNSFHDLREVLKVLNGHACTSSVPFLLQIIECLSCLFKNCVLFKYHPAGNEPSLLSNLQNLLFCLATYIDNLCILGSMQHPEKESVFLFLALDFYGLVVQLIELGYVDLLIIPSAPVVCAALFSFSASHLSQLCLLFRRYKNAVAMIKSSRDTTNDESLPKGITLLNKYILDTCDTIWRAKGFVPRTSSCVFEEKLPSIVQETVREPKEVFAAYRHPALLITVDKFMGGLEDIELNPRDIISNKAVKHAFLQHLSSYFYDGIISFWQTFFKSRDTV